MTPAPSAFASFPAPASSIPAADWRAALSREEIQDLLRLRDLRSWGTIAINWSLVLAAFALVAWAPNPLTIVVALFVLGARQLGCAVVMHEASHRTLFRNRRLNDWAGNWLGAYPVWSDVQPYRPYHLLHHAKTATEADPDIGLVRPFPITRRSLWRKVWRDLSGQTGWKQARAVLRRDLGLGLGATQRTRAAVAGESADVGFHKILPVLVTNGILLGLLALAGHAELYLLWVLAWFTTYRLVTRLRSIAEHALADGPDAPLRNTRTTRARAWERLLLAPNRVNFHLEHHLLMTVPHYNLPRMHRWLRERGVLDHALVSPSYLSVLREASSKADRAG